MTSDSGLAAAQAYGNHVQREVIRADEHLVEAVLVLAASVKELARVIERSGK